jgi:hypothetical protein
LAASDLGLVAGKQEFVSHVKTSWRYPVDSHRSLPSQEEQAAKKAYSTPRLVDLGAVEELSLAGTGSVAEGPGSKNSKKHP